MAVRTLVVDADPETGQVDRERLIAAIMDAEATLWVCGGVFTVVVDRRPTGFPNEMVHVRAAIEWKDRTDARPQPEPQTQQVETVPAPAPTPLPPAPEEPEPIAAEADPGQEELALVGGGEPEDPEEEDVSEIPAALR